MRSLFLFGVACICSATVMAQRIGIGTTNPTEVLQVDSTIKIGKNSALGSAGRKNLLKFGDDNYVTIGEEVSDDKLYIRFGNLSFLKTPNSIGSGRIGMFVDTATASLDLAGTLRIRGNGAADGRVLTSDENGNASWTALTIPVRNDVYTVGSVDFKAVISSNVVNNGNGNGGAYYTAAVGTERLIAPVHLPHGAKVTQITYTFYDNTAQDFEFEFGTEYATGSGYGPDWTISSSGSVAGWRSVTYTPSSPIVINNNNFSYYVSAYTSWPGTFTMAVKAAIFQYNY